MSNFTDFISGGGGIKPPKTATGATPIGGVEADQLLGANIPMPISEDGEYITILTTLQQHYDPDGNQLWEVLNTAIQAAATTSFAHYWDKVDAALYVLTADASGNDYQFASIDPTDGAVTLLGAVFQTVVLDAITGPDQVSITRAVQGTGNFLLSLSNTAGQASAEITPAGGGVVNVVSNIALGGVNPYVVAPYKVDSDLYIGKIAAPGTFPLSSASTIDGKCFLSMVSSKRIATKVAAFNTYLGCNQTDRLGIPANIIEWGDDIAIWYHLAGVFNQGPRLLDKADFHRWAKELATFNGLRVTI